jgi:hypothetical protein
MQTTLVKLYSDGRLAESIPLGDVDVTQARKALIDSIQENSPEYTIATFRTHVVNRHQYMFAFLQPFRMDFVRFVNHLLQGPPKTGYHQ